LRFPKEKPNVPAQTSLICERKEKGKRGEGGERPMVGRATKGKLRLVLDRGVNKREEKEKKGTGLLLPGVKRKTGGKDRSRRSTQLEKYVPTTGGDE